MIYAEMELVAGVLIMLFGMIGTVIRWALQYNRKYGYPETPLQMAAELAMGGAAAPIGMELLTHLNIEVPMGAGQNTVAFLLGFFAVDVMEMIFARYRPAPPTPP